MSEQVSLPPGLSSAPSLEEMRQYLSILDVWLRAREPSAVGGPLEKFLTAEAAVQAGLLTYSPGTGGASGVPGMNGNPMQPGNATLNPADPSQPTPIAGLTVTSIVSGFFIEIEAPVYRQGGGNGRTIIYRANYSGAGPLPTFADAVEVGYMSGRSTILVLDAEPGVQAHFWAKAETRHPTLQASPTGGTNGVSAVAGMLSNDHIASLSVSKLIAGTLAVGEYIESTGFDAGVEGFRLNGDGTGYIGGFVVGPDYIESSNYDPGVDGWRIDHDGAVEIKDLTARGTLVTADSGQRVVINGGANQFEVYADAGAGIELVAKVGISTEPTLGDAIAIFGSWTSAVDVVGLIGYSDNNVAIASRNDSATYASMLAYNDGDGPGAEASTGGAGPAVYGWSNGTGHGGRFKGNGTRSQLFLDPLAGRPSNRAVGGIALIYTTGGSADNRTATPKLMYADGADWRLVSDDTVHTG